MHKLILSEKTNQTPHHTPSKPAHLQQFNLKTGNKTLNKPTIFKTPFQRLKNDGVSKSKLSTPRVKVFQDTQVVADDLMISKNTEMEDIPEAEYCAPKIQDLEWGSDDDDLPIKEIVFKRVRDFVEPEFQIYKSESDDDDLGDDFLKMDLELDLEAFMV